MRKVDAIVSWRAAASQAWLAGLGFGLPGAYGTAYFARHGDIWTFVGFPTYRGDPFEAIGLPTSVGLLSGFVTVAEDDPPPTSRASRPVAPAGTQTGTRSPPILSFDPP